MLRTYSDLLEDKDRTRDLFAIMKKAADTYSSTFIYAGKEWELENTFIGPTLRQGDIEPALFEIHKILYCIDYPENAYKKEN